jgi:transposase
MTVKVEEPPPKGGNGLLYIDLGVVNLATIWFKGLKQPIAFSGRTVLSDWWYWTRKIAKEQSRLARMNKVKNFEEAQKTVQNAPEEIQTRRERHDKNHS